MALTTSTISSPSSLHLNLSPFDGGEEELIKPAIPQAALMYPSLPSTVELHIVLQQGGLAVRTVGSPVLSVSNLPRILVTSRYPSTAPHSCTALSSSTELGGPGGDWEPEIPFENLTEPGELVQPGQRWAAVPALLYCVVQPGGRAGQPDGHLNRDRE